MKNELESNKQFIDKLKVTKAGDSFPKQASISSNNNEVSKHLKDSPAKKLEAEFKVKLEIEKQRCSALKEDQIEAATEEKEKQIESVEKERKSLEIQREAAVKLVQQIAKQKEEQQ